jgi:hypothetical protein
MVDDKDVTYGGEPCRVRPSHVEERLGWNKREALAYGVSGFGVDC